MIIAIPKIIYEKYHEYTIAISTLPVTKEGKVIDILKRSMRISDCKDKMLCYPSILGGIFIFKDSSIVSRLEYSGFLCSDKNQKAREFNINNFLRLNDHEISCFKFDSDAYCFSNKKIDNLCVPIDNIGLRFIV
ncbi:hypothetical protein DFR86_03065 [Acidianus sulfidivorans JP7]|uniref:Uncharacterized protein n=1 Tax=Acidianus sulfidivorans JP7 TaxID=619593 RepID=A0A2U9IKR1_9CREN|nr:hypothetical protein [Acidianus sulfidivorans]AWR96632.1 hypothetical protein DFR86_03065 [Acidianus sulfidivorans JP7]